MKLSLQEFGAIHREDQLNGAEPGYGVNKQWLLLGHLFTGAVYGHRHWELANAKNSLGGGLAGGNVFIIGLLALLSASPLLDL